MGLHRWSGWPGAFCLYCGEHDFLERAVGEGWFDVFSEQWDTEEHKLEYENTKNSCPVVPDGVDPYSLEYPINS